MEAVGEVVVEAVVGEGLVDGQADAVEPGDLHYGLAAVVVDGVVAGVADHLVQLDDGLMRHVASGEVVFEQSDLKF